MPKIKIFLSYHKNTPSYKSDMFQPIQVGVINTDTDLKFAIKDNTGDNISYLNPYYCELTGHYWVLKNYLPNCEEDYIGFAHYRRLPDLLDVSEKDIPAIYGINYPQSVELFEQINTAKVNNIIENYDVIYPCSCYMYENTVNPLLRENEMHYNVYEHFKKEHGSDLLDYLENIITEYYPNYSNCLKECFSSEKSYFYNIYIMKKELLEEFLSWQFDILEKVGEKIGGWEQDKYKRMAGFLGETLMSFWIKSHQNDLNIGFAPIYMVDFEAEYIERANMFHDNGLFEEEIKELENLLKITSNKFEIMSTIAELYSIINDKDNAKKYIIYSEKLAENSENFHQLASISAKYNLFDNKKISEYYEKAISTNDDRYIAHEYLNFAERTHDISISYKAWEYLKKLSLTDIEKIKYENFKKVYNMINSAP